MCVYLSIHNKYTQSHTIYNVNKNFYLGVIITINHLTALINIYLISLYFSLLYFIFMAIFYLISIILYQIYDLIKICPYKIIIFFISGIFCHNNIFDFSHNILSYENIQHFWKL